MKGCVVYALTNVCVNVVEYDNPAELNLPDNYYLAPDSTGEIGWTWTGSGWTTPASFWTDVELLGSPTAPTPDFDADDRRIATTFWVRQFVASYLADEEFTLNGGSFSDVSTVIYNAGRFNGTGSNLTGDLISPVFDGTGGNLSGDITGGAF